MRTIKEVLENQEAVRKELSKLLMNGRSDEALAIFSELGYQIRTENQAPLDNKAEFDNEAHELAVFLQSVIEDVERKSDISKVDVARVIRAAKKSIKDITDDVLRTADIRRSLSKFDIEQYRKQLEQGIADANAELEKVQNEYAQMSGIKTELFGEPPIMDDDSLSEEQKYTQIRDNLAAAVKKYAAYRPFEHLLKVDFSKMDPSTEEGRKQIESAYKPFMRVFADLDRRKSNAENNIEIFTQEIETLDKEKTILEKDVTDGDAYKAEMDDTTKAIIESKKEEAHKDNEDKFYGNKSKEEQYKEKFLKFKSHIKDAELTYVDRNGDTRTVHGKTLESYDGMEADLEFMQLTSYKDRLERVSMYRATKDLYAYNPELAKKLDSATSEQARNAIKREVEEQFKLDSDYIRTYHGAQNRTRMQYESYMNAGSALKAMVPLKNADTIGGKLAIAAQNVGRYTGLKIPRFTRIDENGNRVSDVKSGLVALGGDAIIIGTGIVAPAALAIAYGAKTIGVLGMRGYGRIYKLRHKDDMDIPTPYTQKAGARRATRESKYREEGHSTIGAWARSVLDNIRPEHRKEIEAEIIADRNREIDKSIENQYILGAMVSDAKEQNIARQNQKTRAAVHEQVRRSGEVYNDIYREPDEAKVRTVDTRISEAVALGMEGEDISDSSRISFTDSRDPRSTNFAKAKLSVAAKIRRAIESNTMYDEPIGETVWTSSIENRDVAKSITRTTDVKRRIVTVLAGLGLRGLGKAINDTKIEEFENERATGERQEVVTGSHQEGGEIIGYGTKTSYTTTTREAGIEDVRIGDLERQGNASWGAFNSGPNYASGYHPDVSFMQGDDTIQGLAFRFQDPATGRTITYSVSSTDIGNIVHNNPNLHEFTESYMNGGLRISPDTKLSDLSQFITDPNKRQAYESYLSQFSGTEQVDKLLDTVEFAWGRSESMIGRGWTNSEVLADAREVVDKVLSEVTDYAKPIYSELRTVTDTEWVDIMETFKDTREVTDPVLHAIKDGLEKAGLITSLQQLGEATAEVAQPVRETEASGRDYVKLDTADDIMKAQRGKFKYKSSGTPRGEDGSER